jgi:hypothetical protein
MPKARLEFNLPEEAEEYRTVSHASDYYCALWDMTQMFRKHIKYNSDNLSDAELETIVKLQSAFYDILKDNDVDEDF